MAEHIDSEPNWYCPHCGAKLVAVEAIENCWNCKADFLARGELLPTRIVPSKPILPTSDNLKSSQVGNDRASSTRVQNGTRLLHRPGLGLTFSAVISAAVLLFWVASSESIGGTGQGWGAAAFALFFPFIAAAVIVASAALAAIYVLPLLLLLRSYGIFRPLTSAAIATLPFGVLAMFALRFSILDVARDPGKYAVILQLLTYPLSLSLSFAYFTLPPGIDVKFGRIDRLVAIGYLALGASVFALLLFFRFVEHS